MLKPNCVIMRFTWSNDLQTSTEGCEDIQTYTCPHATNAASPMQIFVAKCLMLTKRKSHLKAKILSLKRMKSKPQQHSVYGVQPTVYGLFRKP